MARSTTQAMPAQPVAGLHALARDAGGNPTLAQGAAAAGQVIRLVGVQLRRPLASLPRGRPDRRHRVDQLLEEDAVMAVGPAQARGERRALPVRHHMALRAGFAAIGRGGTGLSAPFFAGMLAASRHARLQSI